MTTPTTTLSARLEGTADNLARAMQADEYDLTLDREDVEEHVAFLRDAAKDAAELEARPAPLAVAADPDARPIEERMAVASARLGTMLAEELRGCKAAAEHGLGAVDSEGTPSFTVSLLATEHRNLQARLAELKSGYREEAGKDGSASDIEFAVRLGACLVSQQMERLVESGIDGSLVATLQAHLPMVGPDTRALLSKATSAIAALSTVLANIRARLTRGEDIVGNAAVRGLRELGQAYSEATGGKTATTADLVAAIHRGAR